MEKIYVDGSVDICKVYVEGKVIVFNSKDFKECNFIDCVCNLISFAYKTSEYEYYVDQQGFGMAFKDTLEKIGVTVNVMKFEYFRM